jgi:predicted amidohydrolase YtcJ
VLINGDIFTTGPHFKSLAIKNGELLTLDAAEPSMIGPHTRVLDLEGKSAIIGLTDAHCHLYGLGADLENVSVRNLASEQEVAQVVAKAAKDRGAAREGDWLVGRGWDQNKWQGQQFPTKASLDAVVSDRPVVLRRIDGHAAWVNSRALAAAGIEKATKDPDGGTIVRAANGEPTGVLVDNAIDLVDRKMPAVPKEVRERRILAAAKIATELGFTAVHEMGIESETAAVYRELAAAKRLPLRVFAFLAGDPDKAEALRTNKPEPQVGRFVMRGVKFFADGALGSRGARLHEPYSDSPESRGLWVTEPSKLSAAVDAAVAGGWQVAIHAIGDAGVGSVLDAFVAARNKYGGAPILRVEHAQVVAPADFQRMVDSRAIASMQPTHATSDMPWAEARVGADRIKGAYAWRTMLNKKIPLAFGSDFPVEEVNPLLGLHAAVTRTAPDGKPAGGWYPAQKLSLDEAVQAFSMSALTAANEFPMVHGDITIFDGALTDSTLLQRKVVMTIVGGEIVFQQAGAVREKAH